MHAHDTFRAVEFGQSAVETNGDDYTVVNTSLSFLVDNSKCADFAAELRRAADFLDPR